MINAVVMNLKRMGCLKRAESLFFAFYRALQVVVLHKVVELVFCPLRAASCPPQPDRYRLLFLSDCLSLSSMVYFILDIYYA